jgi:hypothetical protein
MFKTKKITAYTFAFIILIGCNNPSDTNTLNNNVQPSSVQAELTVKSNLDEAKETQKTIFELIEQAETKKITKKQLDKKAKPLQKHLDSLTLVLNADEKKELKSYGSILFNEMIDRKVIRDNQ